MTQLRLAGDWSPLGGSLFALVLAALAWWLYRQEVRGIPSKKARALPWLRSTAILLITLMLTGPVLHHRRTTGKLTRLLCWVDSSLSMGINDPEMELPRKLLIAEQLGWLPQDTLQKMASQAEETLARAITALRLSLSEAKAVPPALELFAGATQTARDLLKKAGLPENAAGQMERELCIPARELAKQPIATQADIQPIKQIVIRFCETAERWRKESLRLSNENAALLLKQDPGANAAVQRFNSTSRLERLSSLLLGGAQNSLLGELSAKFDLQLLRLEAKDGQLLWSALDGLPQIPALLPTPTIETTNLAAPLASNMGEQKTPPSSWSPWAPTLPAPDRESPKTAIILFSDGQHNSGPSPTELSKLLGDRKIPVFTIGFGQTTPPTDLAIVAVEAPESVFSEDRVRGSITFKEDAKAGYPLVLRISSGRQVVWEQTLSTQGQHLQKVPFDFSIQDLMAHTSEVLRKTNASSTLSVSAVPLSFTVQIAPLPGESELRNNTTHFQVRATNRRRKMLILDGRPRWETRYLRNLFERDPQWEINTVLNTGDSSNSWQRGKTNGTFPADEPTLQSYDLIVFGEVPRDLIKDEELRWISSFVGERGGGLFLIDGRRGTLRQYSESPIAPLFPIRFPARDLHSEHPGFASSRLTPTTRAASLAPFTLASSSEKAAAIWEHLPPPRWVARCVALPGTETLLEAGHEHDTDPAMVTRLYGAGRVVYAAFDESWRWRQDVAGLYQDRFWNQLIPWIAEPPFAIEDERVSLDVGPFLYSPGDVAEIRARVRDDKGQPTNAAKVKGTLWKDGVHAGVLSLESDTAHHGVYRSRTSPLEAGHYEFAIDSQAAGPSSGRVRLGFEVGTRETGELADLTLNEELLMRVAAESQGQYLREEQIQRLSQILAPIQEGHAEETETVLWQSYGWLGLILALLTTEWALRKRLGLI